MSENSLNNAIRDWWMNDGGMEDTIMEMAQEAIDNAGDNQFMKAERVAVCDLADALENMVREENPVEDSGVYADLMNAALNQVDWHDLAETWVNAVNEKRQYELDQVEKQVKAWMYDALVGPSDYFSELDILVRDLAEDAANEYDILWGDGVPDAIYEWANEVAEEWETNNYFKGAQEG